MSAPTKITIGIEILDAISKHYSKNHNGIYECNVKITDNYVTTMTGEPLFTLIYLSNHFIFQRLYNTIFVNHNIKVFINVKNLPRISWLDSLLKRYSPI